jgi:3-hydroxyisobutyrate dehydrogenase-like beta-hydroxyacid dehydrogenase
MRIAFAGLGLMGTPIAQHMMAAGHHLIATSHDRSRVAALLAAGATFAATPREAVADADMFFACRVTPEQSRDTFLGADGVLASGRKGLLCIDLATIDPAMSRQIGETLLAAGIDFVDAPISGGPDGAQARSLSVIAGGTDAALARAKPLFALFSKAVFHMGPVGAGVATKLCNNMITITTHALVAEAMVMGAKSGVDPVRLYEVLRASTAYSRTLERVVPQRYLGRDFEPGSAILSVMTELQSAIDNAARVGAPLRLPQVAMEYLAAARDAGDGARDIAALILPLEKEAGISVAAK